RLQRPAGERLAEAEPGLEPGVAEGGGDGRVRRAARRGVEVAGRHERPVAVRRQLEEALRDALALTGRVRDLAGPVGQRARDREVVDVYEQRLAPGEVQARELRVEIGGAHV